MTQQLGAEQIIESSSSSSPFYVYSDSLPRRGGGWRDPDATKWISNSCAVPRIIMDNISTVSDYVYSFYSVRSKIKWLKYNLELGPFVTLLLAILH